MYTVLVQHKFAKALGGLKRLPKTFTEEQKYETMEMAFSTLTLHLDDKVLLNLLLMVSGRNFRVFT